MYSHQSSYRNITSDCSHSTCYTPGSRIRAHPTTKAKPQVTPHKPPSHTANSHSPFSQCLERRYTFDTSHSSIRQNSHRPCTGGTPTKSISAPYSPTHPRTTLPFRDPHRDPSTPCSVNLSLMLILQIMMVCVGVVVEEPIFAASA